MVPEIGTLRVVTAREVVILSGSFTSHLKLLGRHCHLHGHMSHERYTVSSVDGQEMSLHKPHLQWGFDLGHWCERGTCYHCAISPSCPEHCHITSHCRWETSRLQHARPASLTLKPSMQTMCSFSFFLHSANQSVDQPFQLYPSFAGYTSNLDCDRLAQKSHWPVVSLTDPQFCSV